MLSLKTLKKLEGIKKRAKAGGYVQNLFQIANNSPDLWDQAYANIYPNKGGMTAGVDNITMDGHSRGRIEDLIKRLKENQYKPLPVRRVNIPKSNGKTRPLGIPTTHDKLTQEVWRMILECIYEPTFSDCSHGFRKGRSCHTALDQIQKVWTGTKWFIEFDIKGYFDNINHDILIEILKKLEMLHIKLELTRQAHRLRDLGPHVLRDPRIEDGRRADSERQAADRAGVRRMRVRSDDQHSGLGILLEDLRMADRLRPQLLPHLLSVESDPLILCELPLLDLELVSHVQKPFFDAFLAHGFRQEGQVVPEEQNARRVHDPAVLAYLLL